MFLVAWTQFEKWSRFVPIVHWTLIKIAVLLRFHSYISPTVNHIESLKSIIWILKNEDNSFYCLFFLTWVISETIACIPNINKPLFQSLNKRYSKNRCHWKLQLPWSTSQNWRQQSKYFKYTYYILQEIDGRTVINITPMKWTTPPSKMCACT